MKKAIFLFFAVASTFVGYGQVTTKEKPKAAVTESQKPIPTDKTKVLVTDKNAKPLPIEKAKTVVLDKNGKPVAVTVKDTAKVEKPIVEGEPEMIANDSLIRITGKFRIYKKNVHASYYADKFNGKRTSSGRKFDNKKYTAAHRKFPFGTVLRITNEDNGKSVVVEVTDRGPFSRGREIDLTKRAFLEIVSNKNSGSANVKIEVMD